MQIFHSIFIHWWATRLSPFLGCCECCGNKRGSAGNLFHMLMQFPVDLHLEIGQ